MFLNEYWIALEIVQSLINDYQVSRERTELATAVIVVNYQTNNPLNEDK